MGVEVSYPEVGETAVRVAVLMLDAGLAFAVVRLGVSSVTSDSDGGG